MSKNPPSKNARGNALVIGAGERCACGSPTEVRRHRNITPSIAAKPYHLDRWTFCPGCRAITWDKADEVWHDNAAAAGVRAKLQKVAASFGFASFERFAETAQADVAKLLGLPLPSSKKAGFRKRRGHQHDPETHGPYAGAAARSANHAELQHEPERGGAGAADASGA